ncbi:MAG TPA: choice-of-anchor tandem repeat GloVer-containing protein [Terriglobales bacterium]|jgi:uncharacterized repeat protein (TIGR03803 family)|nr:choice-of-anchor tandem repeat GloVer-containing protein [Terriglobales bacterium]
MTRFDQRMRLLGLCVLAVAMSISAPAQTYTELLSFNGDNAAGPETPLTQGFDGSLYGTTYYGGTGTCFDGKGIGCGVVFKITRNGEFRVVYNFQSSDNVIYPDNDLVLGEDGNLYGANQRYDTIFKITPTGSLTILHTFTSGPGGAGLYGGLTLGTDGNFYGTTIGGGAPSQFCPSGCGTVYKMTPAGAVTTLYSFCPQNYCPDGEAPEGTLAEGTDGNFYGTALDGGLYKQGTIFKITPNGVFTLLYTYDTPYTDLYPGLMLATNGNFYGVSSQGLYQITRKGIYTALPNPGNVPLLPIQGNDGNFYGITEEGGNRMGNIFEMPPAGNPSTLYSFVGFPTDGSYPFADLVQATNGTFYGTTFSGGSSTCNYYVPGCGTIFSEDVGLAPFVAFVRSAGKVGQRFGLLGQGFTGTTSVSLNGTSASFTIKSDTLIVATVPAGATTGYVTVTTPSGTLTSNVQFHVIP